MGYYILCKEQFVMKNGKIALHRGKHYLANYVPGRSGKRKFKIHSEIGKSHWFSARMVSKLFTGVQKFFPGILDADRFDEEDII
jgi:hypothetical protein